jgi:hypothetical protein
MKRTTTASGFLSAILLTVLVSSASAQSQRTFVSGGGSDANPCSRTAPCRTFGQAISQTNPGGEVIVLDSAGYGAFAITSAVSITAPPGVYAGIAVFSGDGIDINAGASDIVILRGLTVNNQGSTGGGIVFSGGAALHIESCIVNGFANNTGISFNVAGKLELKDSIMRGNLTGVAIATPSGTAAASLDHVRPEKNGGRGLFAGSGSQVTIRGSVASGNGNDGLAAIAGGSANAELNIESCVSSNNGGSGIAADKTSTGVATVRVSNSTATDNQNGFFVGAGQSLLSRGNNTVEGNSVNTNGTVGSYTAK